MKFNAIVRTLMAASLPIALCAVGCDRGTRATADVPSPSTPVSKTSSQASVESSDLRLKLHSDVHSHNDYNRVRPLLDALDAGAGSIEADIFAINGQLVVAHSAPDIVSANLLRTMYLDPLRERLLKSNGGGGPNAAIAPTRAGTTLMLLIDFKNDPTATMTSLDALLSEYDEMLSRVDEKGNFEARAVTVVLTGRADRRRAASGASRRVFFDGTIGDLTRAEPPPVDLVPLVSDKWDKHFSWNGTGTMPSDELSRLKDLATKARSQGRLLRFWASPDTAEAWSTLREAGVSLINTDQPAAARADVLPVAP
jgi:predicted nucleic acid-binding Zn ribbon protein